MIVREHSSQDPSQITIRAVRAPRTFQAIGVRLRARARGVWVSGSLVSASTGAVMMLLSGTGGSSGSGDLDFFAEAVPHGAVQLGELRRQPDLLDLAGAV